MRQAPIRGAAVILAAILAVAAAAPSAAQPGDARPGASTNPIIVYTRDPARASAAAALTARARQQGTIRVIVGLDLTMRDDNALSPAQEAAQGRALRDMQTAVLQRSLPGIPADRVVRFEIIPFMSVWVDAGQLQRLFADPQVISIKEDVPVPPMLKQGVPLIQADKV